LPLLSGTPFSEELCFLGADVFKSDSGRRGSLRLRVCVHLLSCQSFNHSGDLCLPSDRGQRDGSKLLVHRHGPLINCAVGPSSVITFRSCDLDNHPPRFAQLVPGWSLPSTPLFRHKGAPSHSFLYTSQRCANLLASIPSTRQSPLHILVNFNQSQRVIRISLPDSSLSQGSPQRLRFLFAGASSPPTSPPPSLPPLIFWYCARFLVIFGARLWPLSGGSFDFGRRMYDDPLPFGRSRHRSREKRAFFLHGRAIPLPLSLWDPFLPDLLPAPTPLFFRDF